MQRDIDDMIWFDALAGRAPKDRPMQGAAHRRSEALAALEGRLLREALQSQLAGAPTPVESALRMAERLPRIEQALAQPAPRAGCAFCRRWRAGWSSLWRSPGRWAWWGGAIVALLLLPHSLLPTAPEGPDPAAPVLRGDGVVLLRAQNPRALRDLIADDLVSNGLTLTRYERLGRYGIDADWPAQPPPALLQALLRHGVMRPTGDELRVEVAAR